MNYTIKQLDELSINDAIQICNQELGLDYLKNENLLSLLKNKNAYLIKAENSDLEVVGFGFCTILSQQELIESLHPFQYKELPESLKKESIIGITNTISIKNEYKGIGIGTAFLKKFLTFFESKNIHLITAFAWKSNDGFNMKGIFKKNNFIIIKTIEYYWKLDSIQKKYGCPSCSDNPPCLCTAVIYSKTI
jgi:ribosomal protein S18 acetylase RimI-like enzyme